MIKGFSMKNVILGIVREKLLQNGLQAIDYTCQTPYSSLRQFKSEHPVLCENYDAAVKMVEDFLVKVDRVDFVTDAQSSLFPFFYEDDEVKSPTSYKIKLGYDGQINVNTCSTIAQDAGIYSIDNNNAANGYAIIRKEDAPFSFGTVRLLKLFWLDDEEPDEEHVNGLIEKYLTEIEENYREEYTLFGREHVSVVRVEALSPHYIEASMIEESFKKIKDFDFDNNQIVEVYQTGYFLKENG
jgi:hypothetical protein